DLDALQLAGARRQRPAQAERRLVVHADDDAVAVAHHAHRFFRRRQLPAVTLAPVHTRSSDRREAITHRIRVRENMGCADAEVLAAFTGAEQLAKTSRMVPTRGGP